MSRSVIFQQAASRWKEMRLDYERYLLHAYNRALYDTGGVLVNHRGRVLHVDGLSLFTGPASRAELYASEELKDHWDRFPRKTLEQFERDWVSGTDLTEVWDQ